MATFPTLYRHGTEIHHPVVSELTNELAHDPTIRSNMGGGYVTSRAAFTRLTDKWHVKYEHLSQANKNTIKTFERSTVVAGSASFTWTNPENDTAYTVRILGTVRYIPHEHMNWLWWTVEFDLEQV